MSYNNDQDPAASTQMFRAFVEGGSPNSPTPATNQKSGSGNTGMVIGIVVAVVVIAAIVLFAMH